MASSEFPYQPPAHVVQLSVQHIDICEWPDSRPASENKTKHNAPNPLYPQKAAPKDTAVREQLIRSRFVSNLDEYRKISTAQPAKGEVSKVSTAEQYGKEDLIMQLHKEELTRHRENLSKMTNHDTRGDEYEGQSNKGKKMKHHSKANMLSVRTQKRRSGKKDTMNKRKGKDSGDGDDGGDEW